MGSLVGIVLSFPTVVFTVLLALCLLYWLFVLFGALDLDAFGAEGAEGAAKGALEGATKGALEGVAKAGVDGADGVDVDGVDGVAEGADGFLASLVSALNLRKAPITVVLTLFSVFGWLASTLAVQTISPALGLPGFIMSPLILVLASVAALLVSSVAIRPIAPLFATTNATKNSDLVGKLVVISTGHVSPTFGQAILEDGGAGLTLQVRADASAALKKGDRCVIVAWDAKKAGFEVEVLPDTPRRFALAGAASSEAGSRGAGPGEQPPEMPEEEREARPANRSDA